MKTAKENVNGLPDYCWGVLLEDNSLIKIHAGESGYQPLKTMTPQPDWFLKEGQTMSDLANEWNLELGITKAERKAMEWGSQFSWDSNLANPLNYDKNGRPYSENNPRPIKQTAKKV